MVVVVVVVVVIANESKKHSRVAVGKALPRAEQVAADATTIQYNEWKSSSEI